MARRNKKMSADELAGIIDQQVSDARLYDGSDRQGHRELALKFFEGEVDIPPAGEHRSKVVSRDVADTHGLILPGLLRIFFASDHIAIYEPTKPKHEEYAEQATDLVNYIVMRECDGYRHFRDALSDGILLGNGILKHWWDKTPEYSTETFTAIADDAYRMLLREPDFHDEVEHQEYPDPDWSPPMTPDVALAMAQEAIARGAPAEQVEAQLAEMMQPPVLHDVTIRRLKSSGRLRIMAMPPEEFLKDRSAKVIDENIRFCAHVQRKTRSELVKDGYPKDKIDDLAAHSGFDESDESDIRDGTIVSNGDIAPDRSTEYVEVFECYVLIDYDGDGIAERRRVVMAGTTGKRSILENEEWGDEVPFSDLVPDPRAHSWRGRGLYDELGDIQRTKTVGLRGILDNTYQILNPQKQVLEGGVVETSMDEVVNPTFGGNIFVTQLDAIKPLTVEHIAPKIAPLLDYMDQVAEKRTGISQRSMAMDMDALQNQSATAVNAAQSAAHSKTEEYARNIAECGGFKRVFSCCLKLITKHLDRPKTIRLRGKFVDMDPRAWDAEMEVTINVGLGTGSRDRDLAMLNGVAAKQEAVIAQMGPFNEFVNIGHLFDTYQKMAEASGLRNADSYFPTVTQEQVAQMRQAMEEAKKNGGDPAEMEARAKMAIEQAKAQAKAIIDQNKAVATARLQEQKAAFDADLARQKQDAELAMQARENALKMQMLGEMQDAKIAFMEREAVLKAQLREKEIMLEAQLTAQANAVKMAQAPVVADTNISRPE